MLPIWYEILQTDCVTKPLFSDYVCVFIRDVGKGPMDLFVLQNVHVTLEQARWRGERDMLCVLGVLRMYSKTLRHET